jgi:cytochrome P450
MNSSFKAVYQEPETLKRKLLLGNTIHVLRNPVDFLGNLTIEYGPVVTTNFLGERYFVLQHPEYIKHVLLDNHKGYYKPGATKLLRLFLGEGLSTSNGELWLRQRRIMQPAFHKQRLEHLLQVINEEATSFINRLNTFHSDSVINISHEFLQLTITVISRAMFSTALKEEMEKMVNSLESLAAYASSWMKSVIKIPPHWPTPANNRFKTNCKVFDEIIYEIIDRRRNEIKDPSSLQGDLLDMLLNYADDENDYVMSEKQLRDEVTTMFMAGHETTAQTMSWITYHLAKEKEIYQTIKDEGAKVFNNDMPSFENLPRLNYTKQVIQETLRYYPPVWAFVRKPLNVDYINEIKIPVSSSVLINVYGMHHHPGYWETPGAFNPSHFDAQQQAQRPPFVYLPFGGGPRLCIGNNFAMMVMQVVISRLCQHFEFNIPKEYIPKIETNITLRAKDGIQLILKRTK